MDDQHVLTHVLFLHSTCCPLSTPGILRLSRSSLGGFTITRLLSDMPFSDSCFMIHSDFCTSVNYHPISELTTLYKMTVSYPGEGSTLHGFIIICHIYLLDTETLSSLRAGT
ncbi:hypothetical protein I79_006867 [Cricetulus griseus]|uniref:Uncharacterized protein n=1 Tax=Cricetulus griseus TaxID=10029 RepID=G3H905_CRIGR|nr:hypothetical protein I79_006867 [Cricetulus griseus]